MRIAVVGGGIAGLAAALRLRELAGAGLDVTVLERSGRLGGKLRTGRIAGGPVETGAEAFLVRGPGGGDSPAMALARRAGLGDALRHPTATRAAISLGGELLPLPKGTLVGVPGDLSTLDGVAKPAAARDPDGGRPLLGPGRDVAVGSLVRDRLGDDVVERLVDPMLGGVYAGRADGLSLAVTMPGLYAAVQREHTLIGAVNAALRAGPPRAEDSPIFATVDGGMTRLVDAVARAAGATVRLGLPVRELTPTAHGWRLTIGSAPHPEPLDADAVILAVPARPASRLISGAVGELLAALDYASVALITLALPAEAPIPDDLSGFLVPETEGYATKAATFFTSKWGHLRRADGVTLLRASLGRYGDTAALQRSDENLVTLVRDELGRLLRASIPTPVDAHVTRWGGALPQYAPGHLDRVAQAREALPATIALAGAAFDGIGIPACVRSGQMAAEAVWTTLNP